MGDGLLRDIPVGSEDAMKGRFLTLCSTAKSCWLKWARNWLGADVITYISPKSEKQW